MLICAGKRVGAELVSHLIGCNESISLVVASSEEDLRIIELCSRAGIDCRVHHRDLAAALVAENRRFDWLLNFWSPHLIPCSLLDLAARRINLHPSLVPHARGSDSTAWTLRKGLPAGVSLIDITAALDEGGIYSQASVNVAFPMRGSELHERLQDAVVALFKDCWPAIKAGKIIPTPQAAGGSRHLRRETNQDRVRDQNQVASLDETLRWMLAHDFHPGTTAEAIINGVRYRIRLDIQPTAT